MTPDPVGIDRRQFVENFIAATSAGALLLISSQPVAADDKVAEDKAVPEVPAEPAPEPPAPAQKPDYPAEEVLLLTCLVQRYPSKHFDDSALQGIYRDLRADVARSRILSEFPLKNSDSPGFVFSALPVQN